MDQINGKVNNLKREISDELLYLGMNIKKDESFNYTISMKTYTDGLVDGWQSSKRYNSPTSLDFFKEDDNEDLVDEENRADFHSSVAKLLYLSKRTRPDILLCVSHLASRVGNATKNDLQKLSRVFGYLSTTSNLGIKFNSNGSGIVKVHCDAAYLVHNDCKSRTGVVATLNGGVIAAKSSKQKIIVKSSTEAELVSLCDGVSWVLYVIEFIKELGYNTIAPIVHEDNLAVINMVRNNNNNNKGMKHVKMKYYFVNQHVKNEEINLIWCKTEEMVADLFTKPLTGQLYEKFKNIIVQECV